MRLYDFTCNKCSAAVERTVPFEQKSAKCPECSGRMTRAFPTGAARGFQPFEAYYDEGLGCDIGGRRERRQVMKALNVIEAGDAKGGARNFDPKASATIKPQPPKGIKRKCDDSPPESWDVSTQSKNGTWNPVDVT